METIKLDLIPGKKMPSLHASQYDDGREHGIDLFENGIAYKLDGTETLTINERKGDDCICSLDIENTFTGSNHIVFASTEQMCAVWGNNICELVIAKGEKTIGTLNFILEIEQSPTEGGIESESEIRNLERQIEEITEEVIGDDYYTKTQTDNAIATAVEGKADKTDTYTKTQVDTALNGKADKDTTYTKTQVDSEISRLDGRIDTKANASDVYTKSQTDNLLNDKADVSDLPDMSQYYDKSEVDDLLDDKANSDDVYGKAYIDTALSGKANVGTSYTKSEEDALLDDKADADNTYTKAQVDDIIYGILPDDTASGSVANFATSLEMPIKSLEVDVNAVQDLHGYDYPWTAGGGKNVFPPFSSETRGTLTLTNDNGKITLNGTASQDEYFDINISLSVISGATYYLNAFNSIAGESRLSLFVISSSGNPQIDLNNVNASFTGQWSADSTITRLRLRVPSESSYNNFVLYPYLQLSGSAPSTWTPYENICPISGVSEINVYHSGINIWNEEWKVGGYEPETGNYHYWNNRICSKDYIAVKPNTTYYYKSGDGITVGNVMYYDMEKNYLSYSGSKGNNTFTTPNGCYYITFTVATAYGTTYNNDISINYPSTDTDYHAYNGTTTLINLGGTYYGGELTQDKNGHRKLKVTHRYATINPREVYKSGTWDGEKGAFWYTTLVGQGFDWNKLSTNYGVVTEGFKLMSNITTSMTVSGMTWFTSGIIRWIDVTTMSMSVADYMSYLETHPISFIFPISEPIIIDLPDGEPIATLIGTNNIYADTGDTEVVFKSSVNDYVSAHSGGNLLGMGGVYLGGAKSGGSEEEPDEGEDTEKVKLDETKVEVKEIGDDSNIKKLGGE